MRLRPVFIEYPMQPTPAEKPPALGLIWPLLGLLSIGFHLWLVFSGLVPNLVSRPIHLMLAIPWVLMAPGSSKPMAATGWLLGLAGLAAASWIVFNQDRLGDQYGALQGPEQWVVACVLLVCVLEMARRSIGWPLPLVAALALAYGLLGPYIPGEFGYAGMPLASFLGTLTIAEGGIWGSLTGVSVSIVAIFVIFGAVLNAGEAGQGFMNIAAAAAGHLRGGAAKVSVISSALFGSISGSASANVASTGAITLPAMTRLGYPKRLAGAVEAVASSGGQIMPPLMGAGAFVMVELTGVPYTGIMAAALLPAILFFAAVWIGIDAYAVRLGLAALPADQRPHWRAVVLTTGFFFFPFATLLWGMFVADTTPQYAACMAILVGALLLLTGADLKFNAVRTGARLVTAARTAGQQIAVIASIILCASIIVGVLGMTGLGVKVTSVILHLSGDSLWPALLLTALACMLLGMEVPTTAAYVICVSVAGPALTALGLEPLQTHLFVFWFALLSTITPPVCGAVFIAAGMVGENWLKVAGTSMKLGVGLYLIPLGMIANPALIGLSAHPVWALLSMLKVGVALALVSYGLIAARQWMKKIGFLVAGLFILFLPFSPVAG
jgi:TRAP transporter 4TM/12TM fusion protein